MQSKDLTVHYEGHGLAAHRLQEWRVEEGELTPIRPPPPPQELEAWIVELPAVLEVVNE
jgi:hypothetical protein